MLQDRESRAAGRDVDVDVDERIVLAASLRPCAFSTRSRDRTTPLAAVDLRERDAGQRIGRWYVGGGGPNGSSATCSAPNHCGRGRGRVGDRHRTNPCQVVMRDGMYRAVRQVFSRAAIPWTACHHEDRGDGVFVLVPPEVPKSSFVESLPGELAAALCEHNTAQRADERIRLRMVLHAGEVNYDDHGVTAASINLAFRLLDARPLKVALAGSAGVLALITSSWFFDEVVRHSRVSNSATYRPFRVVVKETAARHLFVGFWTGRRPEASRRSTALPDQGGGVEWRHRPRPRRP
jgi:hypothetical protein